MSTEANLRPPRAAAVAGLIFSVLMIVSLSIVRFAVPAAASDSGEWMSDPSKRRLFEFALHLVPFAGIAFLWFIGVLRNRLGKMEDQFFATVFFGSGLMFVATLFGASAIVGAFLGDHRGDSLLGNVEAYSFIRRVANTMMNVFGVRMAAVFTFSSSTIALRTAILPRWVAFSGFACGAVLLAVIGNWPWIELLFPLWILVVSLNILVMDLSARK